MNKQIITIIIFILFIPFIIYAEVTDDENVVWGKNRYERHFIGIGVAFYSYSTHWYWYNSNDPVGSREHYPVHNYFRPQILGFYETRALFNLGQFLFNVRGELIFTFIGGTKEDWLPSGEDISSGGIVIGGNAIFKCAYPIIFKDLPISPFAGVGINFSFITSNGKNVGTEYASRSDYNYESGWNDSLYIFFLNIGANIKLIRVQIIPEVRFSILGWASTSWEPVGYTPENEGAGFLNFQISIGYKL